MFFLCLVSFILLLLDSGRCKKTPTSKFTSNNQLKSLFCNTCGIIANTLNETLFKNDERFEHMVGFRLDSKGKKIRKNSGFLHLFLKLEDLCDDWKDVYRTAKRRSGLLYLIDKKIADDHNEFNNIILKPKLLKESSKTNRMIQDMCFALNDLFDDYIQAQQKLFSKQTQSEDQQQSSLTQFLNLTQFCVPVPSTSAVFKTKSKKSRFSCAVQMLSTHVDYFSFKKKLIESKLNDHNANNNPKQRPEIQMRYFLLQFMVYGVLAFMLVLLFLSRFRFVDNWLKKLFMVPFLFAPYMFYSQYPIFVQHSDTNFGIFIYCWYYYLWRLYDILANASFFESKPVTFAFSHLFKNMANVGYIRSTDSVERRDINNGFAVLSLVICFANIAFLILGHKLLFTKFIPRHICPSYHSNTILLSNLNVCPMLDWHYLQTNGTFLVHILINVLECSSFLLSILYAFDYGMGVLVYLFGYECNVAYNMNYPWMSYSVQQFWNRNFNGFLQYLLKTYIYKTALDLIHMRYQAIFDTFMVSAFIHTIVLYFQGFRPTCISIAMLFFVLQTPLLYIEESTHIRTFKFGSNKWLNFVLHSLITASLLMITAMISIVMACKLHSFEMED